MSLRNAISVRRSPMWVFPQFRTWQFDCRYCDDGMEFAEYAIALEWANRHAAKHEEQACVTCGNRPYIREDFQ